MGKNGKYGIYVEVTTYATEYESLRRRIEKEGGYYLGVVKLLDRRPEMRGRMPRYAILYEHTEEIVFERWT